jgi:hypothetical protein
MEKGLFGRDRSGDVMTFKSNNCSLKVLKNTADETLLTEMTIQRAYLKKQCHKYSVGCGLGLGLVL